MNEKVYIILLNYKGWEDTIECIESLFKLKYTNFHVVLVDNCSPNNSISKIREWADGKHKIEISNSFHYSLVYPEITKPLLYDFINEDEINLINTNNNLTIINASKNEGFSHGNNIGIKFGLNQKDASFFWILNNDTVVTPDSLTQLVAEYQKRQNFKIGILGCKVKYYHQPNLIQCLGGATYNKWLAYGKQVANQKIDSKIYDNDDVKLDLIIGASMFVDINFIDKVGLLGEDYFLYFEEQDWAERAIRKGFSLEYTHKAVIYHKEGGSIGGNQLNIKGISKLSDFYYARNKIIFTKKFHSKLCVLTVYLSFILIILNRIRRGQPDRIPMLVKILFNPYKHFENS
jgi:GT2 family glycosyltransferase